METIWHNLRKKPIPYEYVLVETYTKHYPYRVCYMLENGVWRDAYKTSYYYPNHLRVKYGGNDFKVKRWAYINDIK